MAESPGRKLTQEEAWEAVERYGGKKTAAKALGVPTSTFYYQLHPEKNRANYARYREANLEAERERSRRSYDALSGPDYNRLLLRTRRTKALGRMAERNQRAKEAT